MGRGTIQRGGSWAVLAGVILRLAGEEVRPETTPVAYHATRYTAEQGLPQNTVRALLQTRDGYLWAGTLAGLARFDGLKFKVFDISNTPEMSHDAINALAEDLQDGSLWINTGNELLRYHQHRFERFDKRAGFPHPFGELWPARRGGLWYSPAAGELVLLQNRKARAWQLVKKPVLAHRILRVEEDENGVLLVLMYAGLFRFNLSTGDLSRFGPPAVTDTSYRSFYRGTNGTFLVAAREGLWRLNGTEWERVETVSPGDTQCPVRVIPAKEGGVWIPWSEEGPPRVARFAGGRSEFLDLSSLPDYPVNRFLQDREGHLWLATESGLCQLRPKSVRVYAREQGLRNDFARAVVEGADGTIWVGTAAGVSGIKNGQVTNLPPVEPSNWGRAEGLLADRSGRVWYGVQANSVAAFDRGAWVSPAPLSLGQSWVRMLFEDRSGSIWGAFDQGVARFSGQEGVRLLPQTLSHPDVRVIHQDRRGDMWFGTYGGGLNRLREGQMTAFSTDLGDYNNRAWCIHEDADGIFWVGSRRGLNRFIPPGVDAPGVDRAQREGTNSGQFFTFTTQHGLQEDIVNSVQEDDSGNLWLSGPQGIYRVSRLELNEVAAGRSSQATVLALGESDGMLNSQCNGGVNQPAGCKDRSGRIWFPTARGVAVVDPRTVRRNEVPPPVVIEQVLADDEVVFGDDSARNQRSDDSLPSPRDLRLAAGRARVLEIRYTANSFAAPRRMQFKYRLEGYDRDWRHDRDNRRSAFYTRLKPGAYSFHVTACNNHGVWNETPAVFSFSLAPFFWQTWPFYVLVGALVIGTAAGVQAYRLGWQRRVLRLEHQQALADERARIARDLHDDLGTALTGLALKLDVARREKCEGAGLTSRLAESAAGIRSLAERMREVVWAVNPRCDTVPSVASFLEQQAAQFAKADGLRCRLDFPEDIPPLPLDGEMRHQLALGVREALSNAVRHAAATEIVLGLRVERGELVVRVADDGRGFLANECQALGRGLANMQARLAHIGGRCECRSAPGTGTSIEMRVPLGGALPV